MFLGSLKKITKNISKGFLFQPGFQLNTSRTQAGNIKDVKHDTVTDFMKLKGFLDKIHKCVSFKEVFLS
jgi:hypothetical protein